MTSKVMLLLLSERVEGFVLDGEHAEGLAVGVMITTILALIIYIICGKVNAAGMKRRGGHKVQDDDDLEGRHGTGRTGPSGSPGPRGPPGPTGGEGTSRGVNIYLFWVGDGGRVVNHPTVVAPPTVVAGAAQKVTIVLAILGLVGPILLGVAAVFGQITVAVRNSPIPTK